LITGAVIGSFVGIVLIIIIVYFVAFKKKNTIASAGTNFKIMENNWYGNICLCYHYIAVHLFLAYIAKGQMSLINDLMSLSIDLWPIVSVFIF
jgi:hypothetical protein